jgi:hypothetical protein
LQGNNITVDVKDRISLEQLRGGSADYAFYSLLVQTGYLAIVSKTSIRNQYVLTIPNEELRIAWEDFILDQYVSRSYFDDLFRNIADPTRLAHDIQTFMTDQLSYYDLITKRHENKLQTTENTYHVFLLGLVAHYGKAVSNGESGDGRYDILLTIGANTIIFELKATDSPEKLLESAQQAINQIKEKRYTASIPQGQIITMVGMALHGKQCKVVCERV